MKFSVGDIVQHTLSKRVAIVLNEAIRNGRIAAFVFDDSEMLNISKDGYCPGYVSWTEEHLDCLMKAENNNEV